MPRKCLICTSKSTSNITLFQFPADNQLKTVWAEFANVSVNAIRPNHTICSNHFTLNSFNFTIKEGHKRVLKKNAIPTIHWDKTNFRKNYEGFNNIHNVIIPTSNSKYKKRQKNNFSVNAKSSVTRVCCICGVVDAGISQFNFPKNPSIRSKWAQFCNIDETQIQSWYRVCRNHFTSEDLVAQYVGRPLLKKSAVPSLRTVVDITVYKEEPQPALTTDYNVSTCDQKEMVFINNTHNNKVVDSISSNVCTTSARTGNCSSRFMENIPTPYLKTPQRPKQYLDIVWERINDLCKHNEQLQRENKKLKRKIVILEKALSQQHAT